MAALRTAAGPTANRRRRVANRRPRNTISSNTGVSTTVSKIVMPTRPREPHTRSRSNHSVQWAERPRPGAGGSEPAPGKVHKALAERAERQKSEDNEHEPARTGGGHQAEAPRRAKPRRPQQEKPGQEDERHERQVRGSADEDAGIRAIRNERRRENDDGSDRPAPDQHEDSPASAPGRRQ